MPSRYNHKEVALQDVDHVTQATGKRYGDRSVMTNEVHRNVVDVKAHG